MLLDKTLTETFDYNATNPLLVIYLSWLSFEALS